MKNPIATTPNHQVTKETTSVVKNIVLDGVKTLKAERITTTFEVDRELHPETNKPFRIISKNQVDEVVKPISFDLIEVTPADLAAYRKSGISSFVLKVDGNFYYTSIPDNINFVHSSLLGVHRCATSGHECNHLSAASDEQGGCAKVRDRYNFIEKYPWITTGYETFNTKHDSFVVVDCLHYEKCPPRVRLHGADAYRAKLAIAQHIWPDVTSRAEVLARVKANLQNNDTSD